MQRVYQQLTTNIDSEIEIEIEIESESKIGYSIILMCYCLPQH